MSDTTNKMRSNEVMIFDQFFAPGVPEETMRRVFGDRTPDPRVQVAELIFEHYVNGGATPGLLRNFLLRTLTKYIDDSNIRDLISLLAKRGYAQAFFDLTIPSIDRDRALQSFLLEHGLSRDDIRYYAGFHGISPKEFIDGFAFGVGESFAAFVLDLPAMAEKVAELHQRYLRDVVVLAVDPRAGLDLIQGQVSTIVQVFSLLLKQLDLTTIPARLVAQWNTWNATFSRHLENLEPFEAGRTLGNLAGDLYQMLTGLVALARLLKTGMRLVIRYASLLFGSVRKAAVEARAMVMQLGTVLAAIGKVALEKVQRVGFMLLRTLFPPGVLQDVIKDGRALVEYLGNTLVPVTDTMYFAAAGVPMGASVGVIVGRLDKPVLVAVMTDRVPTPRDVREFDAYYDELMKSGMLEETRSGRRGLDETGKLDAAIEAELASLRMTEARLSTIFKKRLQWVAFEEFVALRDAGQGVNPSELGRRIHARMAAEIKALISKDHPALHVYTERSMDQIVTELGNASNTMKQATRSAASILAQRPAQFMMARPELMDLMGVEKTATARTQKALESFLNEQYKWTTDTKIGDLKPDLVVVDTTAGRLINIDWTSSTMVDRFEKIWTDLGPSFRGNWDEIEGAYAKAGKKLAAASQELDALSAHARRETVFRRFVWDEIFGRQVHVTSHEITYDSVYKQFNPE